MVLKECTVLGITYLVVYRSSSEQKEKIKKEEDSEGLPNWKAHYALQNTMEVPFIKCLFVNNGRQYNGRQEGYFLHFYKRIKKNYNRTVYKCINIKKTVKQNIRCTIVFL